MYGEAVAPEGCHIFTLNKKDPDKLNKDQAELFHHINEKYFSHPRVTGQKYRLMWDF